MPNIPSGSPPSSREWILGKAPDLDLVADLQQAQPEQENPDESEDPPCDGD